MENPFKNVVQRITGTGKEKQKDSTQPIRQSRITLVGSDAATKIEDAEKNAAERARLKEQSEQERADLEAPRLKEKADFSSATMSAAVQLTEGNYKSYVDNLSKECIEKLKSTAREKKEADPQFFPTESWTSNCVRTVIAIEINKYLADNPSLIPLLYDELRGLKDQEKIRNILTVKLKGVYATFISKKNVTAKKYEEPKRREIP